ncbi:energy transducer TonB [Hymenobacter monticola]|uniref:Energy transducer TonB n=1 Tax=Hymenobacter monticola TaxID=1705399 RepID=A0ABY4B208_9BACT|nr:energy transducer TonB [Hymenobacter monticola]UOE33030.1 energy transducer TonB [Hymenobacter monticola]
MAVCFILFVLEIGLAHAQAGRKVPPRRIKPNAAPAAPVGTLPLLPRFWQLADSAERADAAEVFNQYLQQFIAYPALALQAGVGGAIYALLTVLPDGRVGGISITRRELSAGSPPIKAVLALDAELQRVAWQLQFKPALPRADSTSASAPAATASVAETTDITDRAEGAESDDSTDVTDATDVAAPGAPVDTVTISYRFAPL